MEHILGFLFLIIGLVIIILCCVRWKNISLILFIAFIIRSLAALIHFYIVPLPDSQADAIGFERVAWEWAQEPISFNFVSDYSYFISWMLSLLYRLTDRSPLMGQSLSVLFGTLTVLVGWLLAREVWGERSALKAAWLITFFPTLILYSALIMREAYIWFFILLGLLGVVRWLKIPSIKNKVLIIIGFLGGALFHGGIIAGFGVFLLLFFIKNLFHVIKGLMHGRLFYVSIIILSCITIVIFFYLMGAFSLPKLGSINEIIDITATSVRLQYAVRGDAAYPEWTRPTNLFEMFWKLPINIAYFLFSPFFWDIREPQHIIGFFDSIFYILLTVLIWFGRYNIWKDIRTRWLFFILLGIIAVFSLGVGNFGTAVRHRAKVAAVLIVFSSPYLPRLTLSRRPKCAYSQDLRTSSL